MYKREITESILAKQLFESLALIGLSKTTDETILSLSQSLAKTLNSISKSFSTSSLEEYQKCFSNLNDHDLHKVLKVLKDTFAEDEYKELRNIIELPLLDRLTTKFKIEREKELSIQQAPNFNNSSIEELLRDKNVSKQSEFFQTGDKQDGVSAGYVANEKLSNNTFLLKKFYKNNDSVLAIMDPAERQKAQNDVRDAVQELLTSSMYKLLLYGRAPKEELVTPDEVNSDVLYIRSKFFENAVPLSEFSGSKNSIHIKADAKNLQGLEGFEKIIASCHILGEADYHPGNLMVQDGKTVVKIDHGRSMMQFHKDFESMVKSTYNIFNQNQIGYNSAIQAGNLSFSIEKYNAALNQMLTQLDEYQIDTVVEKKASELQKAGFNPKGLMAKVRFDDETFMHTIISNYQDFKAFYKDNVKENLQNMRRIAQTTDIISKFSNVSPEFKNGRWLKDFAISDIKEPVIYASFHNIEIEGKSALEWAISNKYHAVENVIKAEKVLKGIEDELFPLVQRLQDTPMKKLTLKKVKQFYDSVLTSFEQKQYLTQQEVKDIQECLDYKKHIENTTAFIKLNIESISMVDKMRYKLATFCNILSLPSKAKYFMDRITPESLNIIQQLKKDISNSSGFKKVLLKSSPNYKSNTHSTYSISKSKNDSNNQKGILM
ncbi:hypothetical protein ACA348_09890 [Orientia tsutsugamushi]|uniref:T4SS effector phosphatidylinositol 3-Kinase RisK1 n=1 Tax=Orientia tsutsugamushi TaxID=784 RepID=UPI003528AE6F